MSALCDQTLGDCSLVLTKAVTEYERPKRCPTKRQSFSEKKTAIYSLINVGSMLTDFEKFHPPQKKIPPPRLSKSILVFHPPRLFPTPRLSKSIFFKDLFHYCTPRKWFYGLIGLQKMAVSGRKKWDFQVFNGMSKFLSHFCSYETKKPKKI